MERIALLKHAVEQVKFTGHWSCFELLDNRLQEILYYLEAIGHRSSGELLALKGCSWVLHERYHCGTEEQMTWTFHHTQHKILKNCEGLIAQHQLRLSLRRTDVTPA